MFIDTVFLVDITFLNFGVWDVLDIAIVAFLIYRIYKLIQGSIAFSIFAGLFTLYIIWWIVNALHMQLVSNILSQFASVGVILLIIVFQPEIRKFLIQLGQSTFGSRLDSVKRWMKIETVGDTVEAKSIGADLLATIRDLQREPREAVFVLANANGEGNDIGFSGGLALNTAFDRNLVESLLLPKSTYQNGAIVIAGNVIKAVGAKFPHSEADDLPEHVGMRHRLGLGATENADVGAVIISKTDGAVSTAYKGYLAYAVSDDELERFVMAHTELETEE